MNVTSAVSLSLDFKLPNIKNNFKGDTIPTFTLKDIRSFQATKDTSSASLPSRKTGWMSKDGHSFIAKKQKRWFVLDSGTLSYFEHEDAKEKKGSVSLKGVSLSTYKTNSKVPKLKIHISVGLPGTKDLMLETSDESNFNMWLTDLQSHIDAYN